MNKSPIILDIETKYTYREFNDPQKLGVSIAVVYDYHDNQGKAFFEHELNGLFRILENTSYIIGYNNKSFDVPVLQAYYPGDISHFRQFDILEDIREKIGRRLALNDVCAATLQKKKSGHGLMAIDLYKEKKFDELKQYCMDDVMITKELFDYGLNHGEIYFLSEYGKETIKVDWRQYMEDGGNKNDMPLTLPF